MTLMIWRTLKKKTIRRTKYKLCEVLDDPDAYYKYYICKEMWEGAWETVSAHENYADATDAFKKLTAKAK